MLRDSGALQSLLLKEVVPVEKSGKTVLVNSLWGLDAVPLVTIHLESELFSGSALVGVVDQLPVPGVQFILGNDLAGGKMGSLPVVSEVLVESKGTEKLVEEIPDVFPVCAVTRSMTARKESEPDETEMKLPPCEDVEVDLSETFLANLDSGHESREEFSLSREILIEQQKADSSLQKLFDVVDDECSQFYITNGILMRRWKPQACNEEDAEWRSTDVPDDCTEQDPAIEITEPWNSSEETTIGLEQKLEEKLSHLNGSQKEDFTALLLRYPEVFRNTPVFLFWSCPRPCLRGEPSLLLLCRSTCSARHPGRDGGAQVGEFCHHLKSMVADRDAWSAVDILAHDVSLLETDACAKLLTSRFRASSVSEKFVLLTNLEDLWRYAIASWGSATGGRINGLAKFLYRWWNVELFHNRMGVSAPNCCVGDGVFSGVQLLVVLGPSFHLLAAIRDDVS
ncbi:hypothetical protein Pmani_022209 [Petrolisthes manimaculis]|uniref:Uncharacterized protein n=1 Tax=Petrolisthes manimaculis TaxID=1843537 RepID=A0AAE1PEU5_9EUCA|nr:hypothetical protein Pmani_022209 [Petrolisthes manimaculis]